MTKRTLSEADLKLYREMTAKLRGAARRGNTEAQGQIIAERWGLLRRMVGTENLQKAIYLFDCDYWLEAAGGLTDELVEFPHLAQYRDAERLFTEAIGESYNYCSTAALNGWLSPSEWREIERFHGEVRRAADLHRWEQAGFYIGDLDHLMKAILAQRMREID